MPGFPLSQLLVGAGNARNAFVSGRRDAQQQAQDQGLKQALMMAQMKRQAEQDQLAQALQAAQMRHLDAQSLALGQPKPPARDPVADANARWDYQLNHPKPTDTKTQNPIVGSDEWKAAERFKASLRPAPQQSFTPTTVKDESGRDVVLPFNSKTGTVGDPIGGAKSAGGGMGSASISKAIATNETTLSMIDRAITELEKHPDATGLIRGVPIIGEDINQRVDPEGVETRALVANIGSQKIHDRTGAAMTAKEEPRLMPFIPGMRDTNDAALKKLRQLREFTAKENDELKKGRGQATPIGGRGGGPGQSSPTATREQQLWDAAVALHGREKVIAEYGPRP